VQNEDKKKGFENEDKKFAKFLEFWKFYDFYPQNRGYLLKNCLAFIPNFKDKIKVRIKKRRFYP
jgi:hypothetical protein